MYSLLMVERDANEMVQTGEGMVLKATPLSPT
jgi:hypothetical protein